MAHSLKKSYEDNLKQIQYLKILNELSSTVNSSLSLELICSKAIDTILKLEGLSIERKGAIFITEKDSTGKKLRMICHKGFTEDFKNSESVIPSGNCLCGLSAETGEIIISESAIEDKRHTRRYPGMLDHGHIVLPIKVSDGIIGVLCLYLPPKSRPSREEIDFLKAISDVLGVAIQNTKNFKTVEILLKELESQQERLRATLNTVPDCIKIIDREGILIDINPAGLQILKASSPEEVLGRSIFSMVESEFQEELRSIINRAFLDGLPGYIQLKIRDLTNEVHYIEGRYVPLKNTEGNIIAVLSISRDITEYKRLEAQLYHTQKMEAIWQLAGGIAHDFNNMLNAIIGFGSLMDMQIGEDDSAKSYLREMMKAAERAADLTKRLLIFSRKQQIKPEPVDLNEIILDFQKIIRRLIGEDILLKIQTHGEKITVLAGRGQIEQVLMNLATNARDAMPDGGTITITTSVEEINKEFIKKHGYGKPRKCGTIIFSNTGYGMEQKVLSRVFEPYFTTKEYGRGTGLGLAIVYGIIKQHDGYIDVWSEPGKGTRFTIYLPLIHDVVSEEESEHIQIQPGHGELILVAEDSEEVMKAIKTMLTTFGYRVLEAKNGTEAVELFRAHKDDIHALLLDVIMPGKNGIEAFEEMRNIKPDVKVLFMSGYTNDILSKRT